MKRDMDLVRQILFAMEDSPHGLAPNVKIKGYSEEEIGYHAYLMTQANLIEGADVAGINDLSPKYLPTRMTWAGHEFLDAARTNTIWKQAKEVVGKMGGASFVIWTAVLTDLVKRNLGLK